MQFFLYNTHLFDQMKNMKRNPTKANAVTISKWTLKHNS